MDSDEGKVITVSNKNISKLLNLKVGEKITVGMVGNENDSVMLEIVDGDFFDSPYASKDSKKARHKNSSPIQIKYESKNPFNSRYGLYVYKSLGYYQVRKSIYGNHRLFGVYDNLDHAYFVRDFLMENEWDVTRFGEIEFNGQTQKFYVIKVIDRVFVLGEFDTFEEARDNATECYKDCLANIFKYKNGIEVHDDLNHLKWQFDQLYDEFDRTVEDNEFWLIDRLPKIEEPSKAKKSKYTLESLYGLTPWQKIIRDEIRKLDKSVFTFDELKNSLLRYKTKNFDKKVRKHLDELIDLDLVRCLGDDVYEKCW